MNKNVCALFCFPLMLLFAAGPASSKPLCPDCNVVLISLDALQGAHVGALGYGRDVTPGLDSLSGKGVLFNRALSAASWTVPATMSWFTGARPSAHKVINKFSIFTPEEKTVANLAKLSPGMRTLTQVLKKAGYATGGFTGDAGVNGIFGFNAGFDVYSDKVPPFSSLSQSVPKALEWLDTVKDGKFFLFLHGYDFHGQHVPEEGFDRRYADPSYAGPFDGSAEQQGRLREEGLLKGSLDVTMEDVNFWRAIYDEKIARADKRLSDFMRVFKGMKFAKKTVFVITADHGTEFFEHGRMDHGATLYDELVHVPLVVIVPGVAPGVVKGQVSTLSIMPTVLDIVGVRADRALKKQMADKSLTPLLKKNGGEGEDAFMETDYRLYTHKRAVSTADGWKLVRTLETGVSELYNLNSDPGEKNDLSGKEPARAAALLKELASVYPEAAGKEGQWEPGCSPVYSDQCR